MPGKVSKEKEEVKGDGAICGTLCICQVDFFNNNNKETVFRDLRLLKISKRKNKMNSACQQKRVRIAKLISLSKPFKLLILTITYHRYLIFL